MASSLVKAKTPLNYPEAARDAGIQGPVVLQVVVAETGDVKEVTVISGDPLLAQAAMDAVRQWKYAPYLVNGTPIEMETQVSINFRLKSRERTAPPLGAFRDGKYSNEFFDFEYPLSRDWVRETEAMRKAFPSKGQSSPGVYVLLAAVHIPRQTAPLEADSSFVLSAIDSGGSNCERYLKELADSLHSQKQAEEKGARAPLAIGGHEFNRADFEFRQHPSHRTFLCAQSKEYLLQWNIAGLSRGAVESVISTLNLISSAKPDSSTATPELTDLGPAAGGQKSQLTMVKVGQGVTQGMVVKRVQPIYPEQARNAHIQGSVVMSVIISKTGDVDDLEVLEGPIELVVSAVNAVRQWKYRPYILNGEPAKVRTQITVNYQLTR